MKSAAASGHPVLRYLAVARAARDFGLDPGELDPLVLRFPPTTASVDAFADAVAAALLARP
jgi:hypothetical protein